MREPRIASMLVGASRPAEIEVDVVAALEEIPARVWRELPERIGSA